MARTIHIDSVHNMGGDVLAVSATVTEADGTVHTVAASGWVSALTNWNGSQAAATGPQALAYCKSLVTAAAPAPNTGTDMGISG